MDAFWTHANASVVAATNSFDLSKLTLVDQKAIETRMYKIEMTRELLPNKGLPFTVRELAHYIMGLHDSKLTAFETIQKPCPIHIRESLEQAILGTRVYREARSKYNSDKRVKRTDQDIEWGH